MAKKKSNRVKAPAVEAPQTRDQVVRYIREIGQHQRARQRIEAAMNDELAAVREKHEAQALVHAEQIAGLSAGVESWCEANRVTITQGNKTKTVAFASGEVKWRTRPPSCSVRGEADVIEALKAHDLERFIRKTESVNKDAILDEPDAVKGIRGLKINKDVEDFSIEPFETELEQVA